MDSINKKLTKYESELSDFFFKISDEASQSMNQAISIMYNAVQNNGRLLFTGVGKNVPICQKMQETCASLHIPAFFFDPIAAVHGSLGMVTDKDVIIWMSRSGTTSELDHFVNVLRQYQPMSKIIGMCAPTTRTTPINSDVLIELPRVKEIDEWDLVPSTSAICFQLVGDVMMLDLAEKRGLTKKDFVKSHPGGAIGATKV